MRHLRHALALVAVLGMGGLLVAAASARPDERPVGDITAYVADLREAATLATQAANATGWLAENNAQRCAQVSPAASKLVAAAAAARDVFRRYQAARTRFGTQEEIQLIGVVALGLRESRASLKKIAGEASGPPSAAEEAAARKEVSLFQRFIAVKLEDRLRVEGLADVLSSTSFREFSRKATAELFRRLQARGEMELRRLTGLRIRLDVPIGRQIRDFLEAELSRALTKLVVVAGPAGIFLNLVAGRFLDPGRLVSLVGQKLREALRNKGDVERRTRDSIAGLDLLRRPLNSPKDTPVDRIRTAVRNAQRALGQTSFLKGDLGRAIASTSDAARKQMLEGLLADLTRKEKDLKRAIALASGRFFLDSQLVGEDWGIGITYASKTLAEAQRLAKKLGCTITLPKPPTSKPPTTNNAPTAAVCKPATFRMEYFSSLGGKLGEYNAVFGRIEKTGTFAHKCLWFVEGSTTNESFVVFIDRTPIGTPGAIASGNCSGTRLDSHPFYHSRKRQLSVSGGERHLYQRPLVGSATIIKGVLAAAEAAGVGRPCPKK